MHGASRKRAPRRSKGVLAPAPIVLGVACAIAGCGEDDPLSVLEAQLVGETWRLVAVRPLSSSVAFIPDDADYNIAFTSGGTWSGVNSCNTCTGTYSLGPGRALSFASISCTEAACPNPPTWVGYEVALAMVTAFGFEDERLLLFYTDRNGETWEMIHTSGQESHADEGR